MHLDRRGSAVHLDAPDEWIGIRDGPYRESVIGEVLIERGYALADSEDVTRSEA